MNPAMQHKKLSDGGWARLSLLQQLGNVGSEVGRAVNAKTPEDKRLASYRALELLDLTIAGNSFKTKNGLREIARAREVLCDFLLGDNIYHSDGDSLERYFMNFAVAAQLNK